MLSIDVEDWFHVQNLGAVVRRESWDERELRVERNMDLMLGLMAARGVRSTCFVLGWVAERCPALVRRIAAEGHEIASHGYGHQLLSAISPQEFRDDVRRSKALLEDLTGAPVLGYRAPNFSITDWAIPILADEGFRYDSSSFPTVAHDRYGRLTGVGSGQTVVELHPGLHEVSVSCLEVGPAALPWGGGAYFRLMPYPVFRRGVARIRRRAPYVFYIHPWELDPGQPRVEGVAAGHRFRHYVALGRTEQRFGALLDDFSWTTALDLLHAEAAGVEAHPHLVSS